MVVLEMCKYNIYIYIYIYKCMFNSICITHPFFVLFACDPQEHDVEHLASHVNHSAAKAKYKLDHSS